MLFMDAFLDELNKIADINMASTVAPMYMPKVVKKPVVGRESADGKGGFVRTPEIKLPSGLDRFRTGNVVGATQKPRLRSISSLK